LAILIFLDVIQADFNELPECLALPSDSAAESVVVQPAHGVWI
jgi:hypothetical protein